MRRYIVSMSKDGEVELPFEVLSRLRWSPGRDIVLENGPDGLVVSLRQRRWLRKKA